jgi:hypothetical protein
MSTFSMMVPPLNQVVWAASIDSFCQPNSAIVMKYSLSKTACKAKMARSVVARNHCTAHNGWYSNDGGVFRL